MILLTWVKYDQYIQQTMQISGMWNHKIDLNLIYIVISAYEDINKIFELLFEFDIWKSRDKNEQKYKKKMNKFVNKRCCNHSVNLFLMFFSEKYKKCDVEGAVSYTVNDGLPFVEKDNK
ncbi:hypothetical protein RFI_28965 [Reticulomyxa filosa]|uniref:Uncharacterized protein n=1 Tax=Reticulomyxa filosa TaxID=46433 RepID=X6M4P0_RETFI|nr:hypothetical protein RFI_28965 [Reticulomyxa filosa]|eukprot:ETO08422.1 hypothetical protein RFI_28965 [Reticulomyxa filosa]